MDPVISAALEPAVPGRALRWGGFVPGLRRTADQIVEYAEYWRLSAEQALAGGGPVIVALGDSLAQGIGASAPHAGYVGRVANAVDGARSATPVVNLSRSGARIGDVLDTQLPALNAIDQPIAALMCTVGNNDLVRSARIWQAKRQLTQLLEALPPIAVVGTLPARGSMAATLLNRHLRSEANRLQISVADVDALLTSWRGRRAADRFHPNDTGYDLWVEAFQPLMPIEVLTKE